MLGLHSCRSYRIPRYFDPKFLWYWIYNWQFVIEALFNIDFFSSCYNFLVILLPCLPVTAHIWGSDWQNARRNMKLIAEFYLGDISVHSRLIMKHLPDLNCESMNCFRLSVAKEIPYINNHFVFLYSRPSCKPRCCQQSHLTCSGTRRSDLCISVWETAVIGSLCKQEFVRHGKWVGVRKQNEVLDYGDGRSLQMSACRIHLLVSLKLLLLQIHCSSILSHFSLHPPYLLC
jgi:hypothetical protein